MLSRRASRRTDIDISYGTSIAPAPSLGSCSPNGSCCCSAAGGRASVVVTFVYVFDDFFFPRSLCRWPGSSFSSPATERRSLSDTPLPHTDHPALISERASPRISDVAARDKAPDNKQWTQLCNNHIVVHNVRNIYNLVLTPTSGAFVLRCCRRHRRRRSEWIRFFKIFVCFPPPRLQSQLARVVWSSAIN